MTNSAYELLPVQITPLLIYYGFDLKGKNVDRWVEQWMTYCSPYWVRLAVVEAIYQGRYKAISVEPILERWSQKGHPVVHFTRDFECLICRNLPEALSPQSVTLPLSRPLKSIPPKTMIALTPIAQLFPDLGESPQPVPLREAIAQTQFPTQDQQLEPIAEYHLALSSSVNRPESSTNRLTGFWSAPSGIHRFIPSLDESELYNKLRWVVHQELAQKLGT